MNFPADTPKKDVLGTKDLEELIGSLGIDLETPQKSVQVNDKEATYNSNSLLSDKHHDISVLRFGSRVTLRGSLGFYLTALPIEDAVDQINVSSSFSKLSMPSKKVALNYDLGISGLGIGDPLDCLTFGSLDARARNDIICYGNTVTIKANGASDRLLGVRDGGRLGFYRNLVGQGEKWTILKAAPITGRNTQLEDVANRGHPVHLGDHILLQAGPLLTSEQTQSVLSLTECVLSLHEGSEGAVTKLVGKNRISLGTEMWQVEGYLSQASPPWLSRPYLSGRAVLIHTELRDRLSLEKPTQVSASSTYFRTLESKPSDRYSLSGVDKPSLIGLNLHQQIDVLVNEVLYALIGIEGQIIRVSWDLATLGFQSSGIQDLSNGTGSLMTADYNGYSPAQENVDNIRLKDLKLEVVGSHIDTSIKEQVKSMLPLCEYCFCVREFVRRHSRYEYGLVSHAIAAELKSLLREFDLLVAQLEESYASKKLTLQKLIFMVQPSTTLLKNLSDLCNKLDCTHGGEMIDILYRALHDQADSKARKIYTSVFNKAITPYLRILEHWVFKGELQDVYNEFMVIENESLTKEALTKDFNAQYWEARYTLNVKHVPSFLLQSVGKILVAGKYVNVITGFAHMNINEILLLEKVNLGISTNIYKNDEIVDIEDSGNTGGGNNFAPPQSRMQSNDAETVNSSQMQADRMSDDNERPIDDSTVSLQHDMSNNEVLAKSIAQCYFRSSRALLQLLENKCGLSSHLRSLRRFFLLEHGDFFIQFMDIAQAELSKDVKDIKLLRIQSLLQLAIQSSTLANEANKEHLTCSLENYNLIQHLHLIQSVGQSVESQVPLRLSVGLKGVEALILDYKVQWPLSIILSRRAVTKYQLLSRLLFFSKYVEMRILGSWQDHQCTKSLRVRSQLGAYFCLRQRMLHFLQNFVYYMSVEVIQPRDHEMQMGLASAQDMDEVLHLHEKFLDSCLKECLLASQEVLNVLTKIMATCLLFSDHVKQFVKSLEAIDIPKSISPIKVVRKSMMPRVSVGSQGSSRGASVEEAEELSLHNKTKQMTYDRKKRILKQNILTDYIVQESRQDSFNRYLSLFEDKFDKEVSEFLEKLWNDSYRSHPQLANLCVRLDYNGYYSQKFVVDLAY